MSSAPEHDPAVRFDRVGHEALDAAIWLKGAGHRGCAPPEDGLLRGACKAPACKIAGYYSTCRRRRTPGGSVGGLDWPNGFHEYPTVPAFASSGVMAVDQAYRRAKARDESPDAAGDAITRSLRSEMCRLHARR